MEADGVPYCECGGIARPDVVLYEEALRSTGHTGRPSKTSRKQKRSSSRAPREWFIQQRASFEFFNGKHLIVINRDPSALDKTADHCLAMNVGEAFDS